MPYVVIFINHNTNDGNPRMVELIGFYKDYEDAVEAILDELNWQYSNSDEPYIQVDDGYNEKTLYKTDVINKIHQSDTLYITNVRTNGTWQILY